jgi:hypothetical protein
MDAKIPSGNDSERGYGGGDNGGGRGGGRWDDDDDDDNFFGPRKEQLSCRRRGKIEEEVDPQETHSIAEIEVWGQV